MGDFGRAPARRGAATLGCGWGCGRRLAGKRFTQQGTLLIAAQRHRTQERNRQAALEILVRLIQRAVEPPKKRVATRPTAASRRRRLQTKTHRARVKQTRASPGTDQ